MQRSFAALVAGSLFAGVPLLLNASQDGFTTPSWRGTSGSEFQGWETFSVANDNGIGNSPDQAGSAASAFLVQHSADAFLTGSGNIYNPAGISSFTLRDTAAEPLGTVVFQARTLGSELDYSSVRLAYDTGAGTQFLTTLRSENNRGTVLGASVSSQWEWDLTGLGISSYAISFTAGDTSLSFDSATLDTRSAGVVPEPTTWALLGLGAAGLVMTVRRSRRHA